MTFPKIIRDDMLQMHCICGIFILTQHEKRLNTKIFISLGTCPPPTKNPPERTTRDIYRLLQKLKGGAATTSKVRGLRWWQTFVINSFVHHRRLINGCWTSHSTRHFWHFNNNTRKRSTRRPCVLFRKISSLRHRFDACIMYKKQVTTINKMRWHENSSGRVVSPSFVRYGHGPLFLQRCYQLQRCGRLWSQEAPPSTGARRTTPSHPS